MMEKPILILLAAAVISFVGSIQIGPVNITVIQTVLQRRFRDGLLVALGGCIPELFYAAAAVWTGMWLDQNPHIWRIMEWASVPALIMIGVFVLRSSQQTTSKTTAIANHSHVVKGFTLAIFNPQLFPYWLFILVQFQGYPPLKVQHPEEQIAFVAGAVLGAWGLLFGVAYLTGRYREQILQQLGQVNLTKALGWLFLGMAALQFFKLIH
ncbi:LysE family translocator [Runella slithyformis]|uniref:Lysine exporter protein (LYSE/YGGA) n=1 Tax=Runella slithyformis (strain ATCC 29530 / DSM 19594 / LMG 11500 / NCIMB 11436 / LSU 4) TaxID=761193 RepID=A0A7U4E545_RUNSL|nr:LysE family transporter [Runella slithyformis]AEI48093.1 Lysine exporter protein (LYSE/YGGA) [Runella slithyformis DSM 19594]